MLERSWRRKLRLHLIFSLLLYNSGERDREQDAGTHHGSSSSAQGNLWRGRSSLFKFSLFLGHLFFLFSYFLISWDALIRDTPESALTRPSLLFLWKCFPFSFSFFKIKRKGEKRKKEISRHCFIVRDGRVIFFFSKFIVSLCRWTNLTPPPGIISSNYLKFISSCVNISRILSDFFEKEKKKIVILSQFFVLSCVFVKN